MHIRKRTPAGFPSMTICGPSHGPRAIILAIMVWLLGGVVLPLPLSAQPPAATPLFRSDRFLVKPVAGADLTPLHRTLGVQVLRSFAAIENLQILRTPPGVNVDTVIAAYNASGFVVYA